MVSVITHELKQKSPRPSRDMVIFFCLHAHAGSHSEGGGDGGKYGNHDVQDLAPDCFVHELIDYLI